MKGRPAYDLFDEVVVQRMLNGTYVRPGSGRGRVHSPERAEAVRRLVRRGYSDGQVAYALKIPRRTALRIRRRHELRPNFEPTGANQYVWLYLGNVPTRSHSLS